MKIPVACACCGAGAVERFIMEGKAAAQLEDTPITWSVFTTTGCSHTPFLVMEFLDGRDLSGLIEKEGIAAISVPRAIHFILQVLRGLQVAHAKGIIHRDIKPSNCFVVHREGEDDYQDRRFRHQQVPERVWATFCEPESYENELCARDASLYVARAGEVSEDRRSPK